MLMFDIFFLGLKILYNLFCPYNITSQNRTIDFPILYGKIKKAYPIVWIINNEKIQQVKIWKNIPFFFYLKRYGKLRCCFCFEKVANILPWISIRQIFSGSISSLLKIWETTPSTTSCEAATTTLSTTATTTNSSSDQQAKLSGIHFFFHQ